MFGWQRSTVTQFLSTPSVGRATQGSDVSLQREPISIHALREEGDPMRSSSGRQDDISIHALREEGDALPPGVLAPPF